MQIMIGGDVMNNEFRSAVSPRSTSVRTPKWLRRLTAQRQMQAQRRALRKRYWQGVAPVEASAQIDNTQITPCPTCDATGDEPCKTSTGNVAKTRHKGRA